MEYLFRNTTRRDAARYDMRVFIYLEGEIVESIVERSRYYSGPERVREGRRAMLCCVVLFSSSSFRITNDTVQYTTI